MNTQTKLRSGLTESFIAFLLHFPLVEKAIHEPHYRVALLEKTLRDKGLDTMFIEQRHIANLYPRARCRNRDTCIVPITERHGSSSDL